MMSFDFISVADESEDADFPERVAITDIWEDLRNSQEESLKSPLSPLNHFNCSEQGLSYLWGWIAAELQEQHLQIGETLLRAVEVV